MAGVLEDVVLGLVHGNLNRPRFGVHARIVHRRPVEQRVGIGAREALDHVKIPIRHPVVYHTEAAPVGESEIGGIDHQRVAFPMAARVARPLPQVRR